MADACPGVPGWYCFAPLNHEGDHDFGGAVLMPRIRPVSRAKARRARRAALVSKLGPAGASAVLRAGRAPRDKGKRGEREVRDIYRAHGWTDAALAPGSGALRPYGPRDVSPWPCDLIGTGDWIVEVKFDEAAGAPSRGWTGEAFVRRTLRRLDQTWRRHVDATIGVAPPRPCAWIRPSRAPWRVWLPTGLLDTSLGGWYDSRLAGWVGVPLELYFAAIAGPPVVSGRTRRGGR